MCKRIALLALTLALSSCQHLQVSPGPQLKSIRVNDVNFTYLEEGQGQPVVFLHGAVSDHRIWESQRTAVASKHRFIALTMRYFGNAPWNDDGRLFSMATHVDDTAAVIRALNLGPVVLVGRSYGGSVAINLTLQHPKLVKALLVNEPVMTSVVTDPAGRKVVAEALKGLAPAREAVKLGDTERGTRELVDFFNNQPGSVAAAEPNLRAMYLENARTLTRQFSSPPSAPVTCEHLKKIPIPTAVTRGEQTRPFLMLTADNLSRCLPNSRLITIKGATHGAPNQRPREFNDALLEFIESR